MSGAEHLESYLLATRQLSPLGARRARFLVQRESNMQKQQEVRLLLMLLLHWWERGAAGVGPEHLLQPLQPENIELQRNAMEPAEWNSAWDALGDCASAEVFGMDVPHCFETMLCDPMLWAPWLVDANGAGLIVADSMRRQFAFSRAFTAMRRLEQALHTRLQVFDPPPPNDILVQAFATSPVQVNQKPVTFHQHQVEACLMALRARTMVLSGGPGTGKTSVVLQLLHTMFLADTTLAFAKVMLCAPTGRAKARMAETVQVHYPEIAAKTLHSLLVQRPDGTFRYHANNPLDLSLVVVDEASMVDLHLFAALLDALPSHCRLLLIGDMHQLPSVDAGAVLGDLTQNGTTHSPAVRQWLDSVLTHIPHHATPERNKENELQNQNSDQLIPNPLTDHAVVLSHTYRSSQGIQKLCALINGGHADDAMALLQNQALPDLGFVCLPNAERASIQLAYATLQNWWNQYLGEEWQTILEPLRGANLDAPQAKPLLDKAFAAMLNSRILVLSHGGMLGREAIQTLALQRMPQNHGRQILLGRNHHSLELYNGDLGLLLQAEQGLQAVFRRGAGYMFVDPTQLSYVESAYAMTVHKSQGSEFNHVLLVLPERVGPLLHRQILYTGITRAKSKAVLLGTEAVLRHAILRRDERPGGIKLVG